MKAGILKKVGIGVLVVLVVLQFFQPTKNQGEKHGPNDIYQVAMTPSLVQTALETSCYDCHSNSTVYPWYTKVQPIGLWMQYHVNEGKEELNFSEFKTYTPKRQAHKLDEIVEMIEEDEMPLASYTLIHKNAVLTAEQKVQILEWAKASAKEIRAKANLPEPNAAAH
jgi:hypothetical protein